MSTTPQEAALHEIADLAHHHANQPTTVGHLKYMLRLIRDIARGALTPPIVARPYAAEETT